MFVIVFFVCCFLYLTCGCGNEKLPLREREIFENVGQFYIKTVIGSDRIVCPLFFLWCLAMNDENTILLKNDDDGWECFICALKTRAKVFFSGIGEFFLTNNSTIT